MDMMAGKLCMRVGHRAWPRGARLGRKRTLEFDGADFRALGVQHHGAELVRLEAGCAKVGDGLCMVLVRAVRKIHAGDVHAGVEQRGQRLL